MLDRGKGINIIYCILITYRIQVQVRWEIELIDIHGLKEVKLYRFDTRRKDRWRGNEDGGRHIETTWNTGRPCLVHID